MTGGILKVIGGTITGKNYGISTSGTETVTVSGGTIKGNTYEAIGHKGTGTLTINNSSGS